MDSFTYSYFDETNKKYMGNVVINIEPECIEEDIYAEDIQSNECKLFTSSCEVPTDWKVVNSCPTCEDGKIYSEGIYYAKNPETNECQAFVNSCIPEDWLGVEGCIGASMATTPAIVKGWNLLGNASNNTQSVAKDSVSLTWTFDASWIQDAPVSSGKGFWARADVDMNGYEFANSGDGVAVPIFTAGMWSLMSSTTNQTLDNILSIHEGATIVWTFIGNSWMNSKFNGSTDIEVGRGYWVK